MESDLPLTGGSASERSALCSASIHRKEKHGYRQESNQEARREKSNGQETRRKETRHKETRREKSHGEKARREKGRDKKPAAKRKPNAAFMKPMTPSSVLAAVIGATPMPRTEVTKKIWDYIKKNKLQDAVNRRLINADEKLRAVFGGKGKVSMFEMTKLVSNHLK